MLLGELCGRWADQGEWKNVIDRGAVLGQGTHVEESIWVGECWLLGFSLCCCARQRSEDEEYSISWKDNWEK